MSLIVRVVAPTGRDAGLIVNVLTENGIASEACADAVSLLTTPRSEPIGPLLLTEESLSPAVAAAIGKHVREQPAWSDFPVIILTGGGRETMRSRALENERATLGTPVLLERPIRTATLVASVRAAVRARERQYQVRAALESQQRLVTELDTEREQLRVILNSTPAGLFVIRRDGEIILKNPAAERILRQTLPARLPDPSWVVRQANGDPLAPEDMLSSKALRTGQTFPPTEFLHVHPDGSTTPVSAAASPILAADGHVEAVVMAISDLSQQKRSELALIQSEKLAAVGRLAASISHEINNPLEAITNLLYLLREDTNLQSEGRSYLSMAEQELARVSQIVSHTLRFHRQAVKARMVTAEELLESVVALYQGRLLNSSIDIVYQHQSATAVTAMEGDMRQVLNNLVSNAIDSMRNGGRLILRTRNSRHWRTGREGVRIVIADTGGGMSAVVRKRVFEAFYTTKGINGTGLGLWISHGIVEKHHGHIAVRSSNKPPRTGTVFSVFLPRDVDPKI